MPELASDRTVKGLQRRTEEYFYWDKAEYFATPDPEDVDEYGQPTPEIYGTEVYCNFNDKPDMEKWADYADIQGIAGELRCSAVEPEKGGKFRTMSRFSETIETNTTFEVVDVRSRGQFGFVALLKTVQI